MPPIPCPPPLSRVVLSGQECRTATSTSPVGSSVHSVDAHLLTTGYHHVFHIFLSSGGISQMGLSFDALPSTGHTVALRPSPHESLGPTWRTPMVSLYIQVLYDMCSWSHLLDGIGNTY